MIGLLVLGFVVPLAMAAELMAPAPGLPLRLADAEAQYRAARLTHRAGSSARGAQRWLELERALRAYRAVEQYWPREADHCAEAAYRRGEVERSLDRPGRSRAAFESVLDHRADPDWGARARLQLAVLSARRGEPGDALQHLAKVAAAPRVSPRWRNRARERRAELLLELGHPAAAYSAAATWLPEVSSSAERVRAVDLQARARLLQGRAEEAAELIKLLDAAVAPLTRYPGEEAAALRRALARMLARAALSSADSPPTPPQ